MDPARTTAADIVRRIGTASTLHLQTVTDETGEEPRAIASPQAALYHVQLEEMSPARTTPADIAGRIITAGPLHLQTSTGETGEEPRAVAPPQAALCRLQLEEGRIILMTLADIAGCIDTAWTLHLQTSTDEAGQ